jgi:hypothetical protein
MITLQLLFTTVTGACVLLVTAKSVFTALIKHEDKYKLA